MIHIADLSFKFQFLVVQLREGEQDFPSVRNSVSIPCGTIKSLIKKYQRLLMRVSIPCGTIKRDYDHAQFINSSEVSIPCGTIKSHHSTSLIGEVEVSIPCGTIKRLFFFAVIPSAKEFQFLVVQLRAVK